MAEPRKKVEFDDIPPELVVALIIPKLTLDEVAKFAGMSRATAACVREIHRLCPTRAYASAWCSSCRKLRRKVTNTAGLNYDQIPGCSFMALGGRCLQFPYPWLCDACYKRHTPSCGTCKNSV